MLDAEAVTATVGVALVTDTAEDMPVALLSVEELLESGA
jgi:hypothetical protein